jgi:hypothetical protein
MASITTHSPSKPQVGFGKLFWVGPLSIGVIVLADLLVRTVAIAFFGVPERFVYLQHPFSLAASPSSACWPPWSLPWLLALHVVPCASIVFWQASPCWCRF